MLNLNLFKTLGIFFVIALIIVWGVAIAKSIIVGINTGDWKPVLRNTGGKLFSIDSNLKNDVELLLNQTETHQNRLITKQSIQLDIVLNLAFLFIIFYLLFKFGNWISGISQFNPMTDVLIIILIFAVFMMAEFLYTLIFLKETIIPLSGLWEVIVNLPQIFGIENVF